jgi:hypothetical protein
MQRFEFVVIRKTSLSMLTQCHKEPNLHTNELNTTFFHLIKMIIKNKIQL